MSALGCWPCDHPDHRVGPLLHLARRLAGAADLDALAEEVGHIERTWIDGRLAASDRLGLLALWRRRHHELLDQAIVTPTREDPQRRGAGGLPWSDQAGG